MGLYEGIKDVAGIIQKADNIELYEKLLDLGSQALDLQSEMAEPLVPVTNVGYPTSTFGACHQRGLPNVNLSILHNHRGCYHRFTKDRTVIV